MSSTMKTGRVTEVSRAIREAQRILLRNDLDPFEFDVDIHMADLNGAGRTYDLVISAAGGAVMASRSGISGDCIEDGWVRSSGGEFASIVEGLVPTLLDGLRTESRKKTPARGK